MRIVEGTKGKRFPIEPIITRDFSEGQKLKQDPGRKTNVATIDYTINYI